MRNTIAALSIISVAAAGWLMAQTPALDVYFIDVEGGQATLFVAPTGQSMLVDAGFPGDRDAGRIAAVASTAGVKQIDYFVNTHFHADHIGGVAALAAQVPIRNFVDHGANIEAPAPGAAGATAAAYNAYVALRERGQYSVAKPGGKVPIAGIDVAIVSAADKMITSPLPGAGAANPACADFQPKDDASNVQLGNENAQSTGMVISYGRFRMLDIGDLTWNREHQLACPNDLIGPIDLYLTTHHGQNISNLPALVKAVAPRVAIMNNGGRKGGNVETFQTLHALPGLLDLWQLHFAVAAGKEHNTADQLIANLDDTTSHYLKLTARNDGSFTVLNTRSNFSKSYASR
jgi:beta-lactamase superfamily II metal-dependent hydrolase